MNVPTEIRDRYAAGERVIRVSPQTYQDYCDGLVVCYRRSPNEQKADTERWIAYKDAKVMETQ